MRTYRNLLHRRSKEQAQPAAGVYDPRFGHRFGTGVMRDGDRLSLIPLVTPVAKGDRRRRERQGDNAGAENGAEDGFVSRCFNDNNIR